MRPVTALPSLLGAAIVLASAMAAAQPPPATTTAPAPATTSPATTPPAATTGTPPPLGPKSEGPITHGDGMRAYHVALLARRLGWQDLKLEDVKTRLADFWFTRRMVREATRVPDFLIKLFMRQIEDLEYIQVERAQRGDHLAHSLFGLGRAGEFWFSGQQQHRCHVRTVDRVDEVGVTLQPVADQLQCAQLLRIG